MCQDFPPGCTLCSHKLGCTWKSLDHHLELVKQVVRNEVFSLRDCEIALLRYIITHFCKYDSLELARFKGLSFEVVQEFV